jgi:hypothetical protein
MYIMKILGKYPGALSPLPLKWSMAWSLNTGTSLFAIYEKR